MHAHRPSLTAAVVSFLRGAVSRDAGAPCFDPVASSLLPAPFTHVLKLMEGNPRNRMVLEPFVRAFTFGLTEHVELRTAVIDHAMADGVLGGARQLLILGAGLDSRAWRMGALADVDVFEIDHPNTQLWKTERVSEHQSLAKSVRFVPVDFERTSLGDALDATDFRRDLPTFWIWEGVTPYLNPHAIESTLAAIAARSAPRSRIAISYVTPEVIAASHLRALTFPVFKLISEPLHGIMTPEQMHDLLRAHGFEVLDDDFPSQAGPRFGRRIVRGMFTPSERVVVARK